MTLAVLCLRWERDEIGTYTIHEMVDTLTWTGTPRRADGTFSARPAVQLVLELVAGAVRGWRPIEVALFDERERLVGERQRFQRKFDSDESVARIVERLRFPDAPAGDYILRVLVAGDLVVERRLRMRQGHEGTGDNRGHPGRVVSPVLVVARHCVGSFNLPQAPHTIPGLFEGLGIDVPAKVKLGFLAFFIGGTEESSHTVSITTYGPDGSAASSTCTYEVKLLRDQNMGLGNPDHVVSASEHGTYWTEIRLDQAVLCRVPLQIYRSGTRDAASGDDWQGEVTFVGDDGAMTEDLVERDRPSSSNK